MVETLPAFKGSLNIRHYFVVTRRHLLVRYAFATPTTMVQVFFPHIYYIAYHTLEIPLPPTMVTMLWSVPMIKKTSGCNAYIMN